MAIEGTKVCVKCEKVKPFTDFYIHEGSGNLRNVCKACHNPKKEWGEGSTLACKYCGKTFLKTAHNQKYCGSNCKSSDSKHRTGKSKTKILPGQFKECLECHKQFEPSKHTPFAAFCSRKCGNKNRQRDYRRTNRDKVKLIEQKRYAKHKDKRLAYSRAWGKTPTGRANKLFHTRNRQEKLKSVIHVMTKEEWQEKIAAGVCQGYQREAHFVGAEKLERDHKFPLSLAKPGYVYSANDYQALCRACNAKKRNSISSNYPPPEKVMLSLVSKTQVK